MCSYGVSAFLLHKKNGGSGLTAKRTQLQSEIESLSETLNNLESTRRCSKLFKTLEQYTAKFA